jgi:hypothetical protein
MEQEVDLDPRRLHSAGYLSNEEKCEHEVSVPEGGGDLSSACTDVNSQKDN